MPERGVSILPFILLLVVIEWLQRSKQHGLQLDHLPIRGVRWTVYFTIITIIFCFGANQQNFIYFQF
jgi:hypothetical protein